VNRNYIRGRAIEYLAKKQLEKEGYYVIRSSGSHGACDICAFSMTHLKFIQLKRQKVEHSHKEELDEFTKLVVPISSDLIITREFWVWTDRKGFEVTLI